MQSRTFVPASGSKDARLVIVAEQPGKYELMRRTPFVGPAGELLNECLHVAGIARSECYLTNVIKDLDAPLSAYIHLRRTDALWLGRGKYYEQLLREELALTSANVIVAMGNVALSTLCSRVGITSWRGSVLESTLLPGRKIVPTIHPATYTQEKLRKNPSAYLNKYLITHDLKRALAESEYPEIRRLDRRIITQPKYAQVMQFLKECKEWCANDHVLAYDIEITHDTQELSCISFALGAQYAMSIPFEGPQGDYFTAEQEAYIMLAIERLMSNPTYVKLAQNGIFDSHFLLRKYGIRTYNLHDTMIAQKILYPEFRVRLEFSTSMWTDIPYYKADGKLWISGKGTWDKGWIYNALDSLACADMFPKQLKELEEHGNSATYERQRRLVQPLTFMMERGILIDTAGMRQAYEEHEVRIDLLQERLNSVAGRELNYNSPKQLREYFYETKGLSPYFKDGSPTVDEDALKRISFKGFKEAQLILELRRLNKRRSTYLDTSKVDKDGRMRCAYNPVGTKFSRISSSENIFGTGMNLQNVPHDILSYFIADKGYVIYELDKSQIENRIVAYVGNITPMIKAFEANADVHTLTAALIFGKHYNAISREPGSSKLGDGKHSERDFGKIANHALNYALGYRSFAMHYEIPEYQAKYIHGAYHAAYPQLANGYWEYVKQELLRDRTLTNLLGRRVRFLGQWGEALFKEAYSCIPQGTCGDLVNEYGIEYVYYNDDPRFKYVELLTQIHDSIAFQVPLALPLIEHARILISIKRSLDLPMHFGSHEFVIPTDLIVNTNLNKDTGVEIKGSKFSEDPPTLTKQLEKALYTLKLI
jgi:uracil-DNA glycosylase family 4